MQKSVDTTVAGSLVEVIRQLSLGENSPLVGDCRTILAFIDRGLYTPTEAAALLHRLVSQDGKVRIPAVPRVGFSDAQMQCRFVRGDLRCAERSLGPRFRYLCREHSTLKLIKLKPSKISRVRPKTQRRIGK